MERGGGIGHGSCAADNQHPDQDSAQVVLPPFSLRTCRSLCLDIHTVLDFEASHCKAVLRGLSLINPRQPRNRVRDAMDKLAPSLRPEFILSLGVPWPTDKSGLCRNRWPPLFEAHSSRQKSERVLQPQEGFGEFPPLRSRDRKDNFYIRGAPWSKSWAIHSYATQGKMGGSGHSL